MANSKRDGAIKKTVKKRNKRRRRRLLAFFVVFIFFLLCVAAVLSATVLFPIKNIVVDGESIYTADEVILASGIEQDDNILMLSKEKVISRISEGLPKSGEIKVKKQFPDTVKITVSTAVPTYFFISDGVYYVTDQSYKVIEQLSAPPENCILLKTAEFSAVSPGNKIELSQNDAEALLKIFGYCNDKQITVTGVDVSDTVELKLMIDGRLLVQLGNDIDIEYKIAHLAAMLPKMEADSQGTIDLSGWTSDNTKATFRDEKIDSLGFAAQKG